MPLFAGLRMVLQTFWLPGEGQQIDRLVQAFAEEALPQCSDGRQYVLVVLVLNKIATL